MAEDSLGERRTERERQLDWEANQQKFQQQAADILRNAGSIPQLLIPILTMQSVCFRAMADGVEQMARSFTSLQNQQQTQQQRDQDQQRERDQRYGTSGQRVSG